MAALRDRLPAAHRVRARRTTCRSSPRTCRDAIASDVAQERACRRSTSLAADRAFAARELQCPTSGDYYERFVEAMGGHAGANAELLLRAVREGRDDGGVGRRGVPEELDRHASPSSTSTARSTATSARAPPRARAAGCPAAASRSSSMLPVDDLDVAKPDDDDLKRADYLVYTIGKVSGRSAPIYRSRSGISAMTYVITAIAADERAISSGSILSIVSAGVWWIRK